jgi:hypothetical protein
MKKALKLVQFFIILILLSCIIILRKNIKNSENKHKQTEALLVDQYLDLQIDNSKLLDHINLLDDEIKILSSCCANGGLTAKDVEYGD